MFSEHLLHVMNDVEKTTVKEIKIVSSQNTKCKKTIQGIM